MNIIVLKTNIDNEQMLNYVHYLFKNVPQVKKWSVDQEDIDKVLRITTSGTINETKIIQMLSEINIFCEKLT